MKRNDLGIDALIQLIETLRGKNGCPWDKKQTPRTMALYLVEEMYELIDAIESGSPEDVCEELGDVLFLIVFITFLFAEMGHFNIEDVVCKNTEKMIRRHPHVFGNDHVDSFEEIRHRWHRIKMKEKTQVQKASILDSVPAHLPALMRAYRISERAARTGFDWEDMAGVKKKVKEEWTELNTAMKQQDQAGTDPSGSDHDKVALEFGDLLFTLVNLARFANIHPETALTDSIKKFENRFRYIEKAVSENGDAMESVSIEVMQRFWEEAKQTQNS
jgi:MazG family protein